MLLSHHFLGLESDTLQEVSTVNLSIHFLCLPFGLHAKLVVTCYIPVSKRH
jgi:hypothetical protein